jgi:hypothetical protein
VAAAVTMVSNCRSLMLPSFANGVKRVTSLAVRVASASANRSSASALSICGARAPAARSRSPASAADSRARRPSMSERRVACVSETRVSPTSTSSPSRTQIFVIRAGVIGAASTSTTSTVPVAIGSLLSRLHADQTSRPSAIEADLETQLIFVSSFQRVPGSAR